MQNIIHNEFLKSWHKNWHEFMKEEVKIENSKQGVQIYLNPYKNKLIKLKGSIPKLRKGQKAVISNSLPHI